MRSGEVVEIDPARATEVRPHDPVATAEADDDPLPRGLLGGHAVVIGRRIGPE